MTVRVGDLQESPQILNYQRPSSLRFQKTSRLFLGMMFGQILVQKTKMRVIWCIGIITSNPRLMAP